MKAATVDRAARSLLEDYDAAGDFYDEAFVARGRPRPHYRPVLEALEGADLDRVKRAICADLDRAGVAFRAADGLTPFAIDPVPRILTSAEWAEVEAGLVQRVRALNAFVADAYSERRIVAAGRVPARVVERADHYEPEMQGVEPRGGVWAHVAGLDLVRGPDGSFQVLEDNLRTPSGVTYAVAAREVLSAHLPFSPRKRLERIGRAFDLLADALRAAAPHGNGDPSVVLLSDGPGNSAWYEHRTLAGRLGVPIVGLEDLHVRSGELRARVGDEVRRVDVVYRRTDVDHLTDASGRLTAIGEALLEPCRRGRLAVVNAFGTGVGDDKLVHAYVEEMIRFYLGEEPVLRSVPTYDLGDPAILGQALERLDELVVKPRTGHGGHGIVICAHASADDRRRVRRLIVEDPDSYVVQETVRLSRHPTVAGGRLAPRHVDLRPYVFTAGERVAAVPGGLTRVAFDPGALVVNSSQNGGGKDTWVEA